ncbi:hypothetical protein B0H16DRAFT_1885299 [Mycena metata]|uniref:Uncharacterized protein n=1 Tax=Mycena metata TaxID=1033252 RepID=A0AAD7J798_9AGAR|nr:hypothetical protein B0H16DRAFT_1885299 [Mycena metata]
MNHPYLARSNRWKPSPHERKQPLISDPQPKHVAYACRVNQTFHGFEIRDFPKSVAADELGELVVKGLRNCVSLRACTWTRDGALNSAVLAVLQASDTLLELEINRHSDGHYDAALLRGFAHLAIRMSPLVTDGVLGAIAPSLAQLEKFSITGCPRVSHLGIWAIPAHNSAGLCVLGLEGLAVKFDIAALSAHWAGTNALARLQSFTLSVHTEAWLAAATALLASAPLEAIHLYATRLHPCGRRVLALVTITDICALSRSAGAVRRRRPLVGAHDQRADGARALTTALAILTVRRRPDAIYMRSSGATRVCGAYVGRDDTGELI